MIRKRFSHLLPYVTLVQHCVCTKLEVSTAFLLRENRSHGTDGQTDRVQRLMLSHTESRIPRCPVMWVMNADS